MKLTTQSNIDKSVIDYINSLTITGMTFKEILKAELGDIDQKELENKRKNYQRKISKLGYKFDSNSKIYILKSSADDVKESQDDVKESQDDVKEPQDDVKEPQDDVKEPQDDVKEPQDDVKEPQDDVKNSKPMTKKEKKMLKEVEEKLKENPLYFNVFTHEVLEKIDYIYRAREENPDQLCMMIYPSLLNEFKKIENRFGYINAYYVQNCAILSCYNVAESLKNSDLLLQYLDFISQNCRYEKKKQFTMRTYKHMNFVKQQLENTFPILNKGDVIGFCFFAFLKCYEKSNQKQ